MADSRKQAAITAHQRRHLKALAHPLHPVVMVATRGITPSVLAELERALTDHELIKVRIAGVDRIGRAATIRELCDACGAELIQQIGHVAVLLRRSSSDAPPPHSNLRGPHRP